MVAAFDGSIAEVTGAGKLRGRPRLGLGAGLATGPVILAHVGSTTRMDYTVVGAAVNRAARLCAEARSREVLCDAMTVRNGAPRTPFPVRPTIRSFRARGFRGALRVFAFKVRDQSVMKSRGETIDPVCGMKVPAITDHTSRHRGRTYRFCSAGCRARFVRSPSRFAAGVHAY
jgi:class 3 adenylate cyclase